MKPSQQIDQMISSYDDWRGTMLTELRAAINNADPDLTEQWKWGTAVWDKSGLVCAISGFKDHVKINFFRGAQLADSQKLFNSGLDSKQQRSINLSEGSKFDIKAIQELVRAATKLNEK